MRTKTLLLTAALTVAGLASSSMAQVYSVNVVGYANVPLTGNGYTLVANPFDNGAGNSATGMLSILPNRSIINTWNGSTFNGISKVAGAWNGDFVVAPGTGFFVRNGGAITDPAVPDLTNTFVGTVVPNPGLSVTNPILGTLTHYTLRGNTVPFAGDLTSDVNIKLGSILPNRSLLNRWNRAPIASGGQVYVGVSKVAGAWGGPSVVAVGEGFFIRNGDPANPGGDSPTVNWIQTAP